MEFGLGQDELQTSDFEIRIWWYTLDFIVTL